MGVRLFPTAHKILCRGFGTSVGRIDIFNVGGNVTDPDGTRAPVGCLFSMRSVRGPKRIWRTRLPRPSSLTLNLLPLTVTQLVLVCFLLQISRATGEICCLPWREIRVPAAVNGDELLPAPVVEISPTDLRVDGSVVDDGIALADRLLILKNNHPLLHPAEKFEGRVLVWADRDVPWSRLREVLAAAKKRDYLLVDFVIIK